MLSFLQGFTFNGSSRKGLSSYEKRYDAKLPKLYQIRGSTDNQYSGRAQKAQIHEKKILSSNIIRYSLLLRDASLQTSKSDWTSDDIRIEKIISAPIWAC